MLDGAGGLEGRERPSKGLQRKDATVAGASGRSAGLATSVLERHRGEAPVEVRFSQTLTGFVKSCTKVCLPAASMSLCRLANRSISCPRATKFAVKPSQGF
jgi:hypothetical protein